MNGYFDSVGNYYEGDRQGNDLVVPQRPDYNHLWNGTEWALPIPSLDEARATQLALLSDACATQIVSGFTCDTLGSVYSYPSKPTDQVNLSASVLASLYPNLATDWTTPFWCADADGNWAFINHTASQIQTVGVTAKVAILQAMGKNAQLGVYVADAETLEDIAAIDWDYTPPVVVEPTPPVEDPTPDPEPTPDPTPEPDPEVTPDAPV